MKEYQSVFRMGLKYTAMVRVSSEWVRLFRIPLGVGQVSSGVEEIGVNLLGVDMVGQNFFRNK